MTRSPTSPACGACVPVRPEADAVGYRDPVVATKLSLKYLARRILDLTTRSPSSTASSFHWSRSSRPVCSNSKA